MKVDVFVRKSEGERRITNNMLRFDSETLRLSLDIAATISTTWAFARWTAFARVACITKHTTLHATSHTLGATIWFVT